METNKGDAFSLNANLIDERLWLGSEEAAEASLDVIRRYGISHILICGFGLRPAHPLTTFTYKSLPLIDLPVFKVTPHLDASYLFISEALKSGGTVLVHCARGRSRSAAVMVAYMMRSKRITYAEAVNRVKNARREIALNSGFASELAKWESTLGL